MKKSAMLITAAVITGTLLLSSCSHLPWTAETESPETSIETEIPEDKGEPGETETPEGTEEGSPEESTTGAGTEEPEISIFDETEDFTEEFPYEPGPDMMAVPEDEAAAAADFVMLSEVVPDAILEIRYYSTYNFVGERIDGYEEPCALMTREAAEALKEVSDDVMAQGYRLKIYDAYRPKDAVADFVRWAGDVNDTKMKDYFYPEMDKAVLFASGYLSKRSGHSRGSTVDLTLFDMKTRKDVDMGGTFDYFGEESHFSYGGLTEEQANNRRILRKAMTDHGFKPISTEWWHFTLVNEPYPDTYFNFPVSSEVVEAQ